MSQLTLFSAGVPVPQELFADQEARDRIRTDLQTSLLVEAGAGAGKTTEMVARMVALVESGRAEVHQVAAVTFTRKAAAELRERFQTSLEKALRQGERSDATTQRLDRALRDIDRAFLGTIHAFCARLLRERPLEAGLDPAFRETMGAEETRLRRTFWHRFLEHLAAEGDAELGVLRYAGLAPHQLTQLYDELVEQPDVEYPAEERPRPDARLLRAQVEALLDRAALLDRGRGDADALQKTLRTLTFRRELGWSDDAAFLDLLATLGPGSFDMKRSRWRNPDAASAVAAALAALWEPGGAVDLMLREWWAHRYPIALRFARRAARAYEDERLRAGTLNFHDLLTRAAALLRTSPSARRELGERYRYLLVDEFQDTDPLQAEVLFLLASDEELDLFGGTDVAAWLHLTPRPGALFVVGDPKQSIYRFRRADMTLYQQVRSRFDLWQRAPGRMAAVVELTTNFRSRPPIERFVNDIFSRRFGAESTEQQARFAPMRVRPKEPPVKEGVFRYVHEDPYAKVDQIVAADAAAVASWICGRVHSGERTWEDFLVLTPNTKRLTDYASALEERNAPVQVSGAGAGDAYAVELDELRLLLRCLVDPGDATLVVAVLTGLLFGLDFEQLLTHTEQCVEEGRAPFSITASWETEASPVQNALATLNRFWGLSRREPADVLVSTVVRELGLLPFAASGKLGSSRAGALLFALDTVRAAAVAGDASLPGALAAIDAALDDGEAEAPLEPGMRNAVRVMNLHKAKGLEAKVVVLAMPVGGSRWAPKRRVVRDRSGHARGYIVITEGTGSDERILARPHDWDEHAAIESSFQNAEEDRLLYVAATRAAEELVVACASNRKSPSRWKPFDEWLELHTDTLVLTPTDPPPRAHLEQDADEIRETLARVAASLAVPARVSYRVAAVTERKAEIAVADVLTEETAEPADVERLGTGWGNAVHDALQALARDIGADELRLLCSNALIAHERPVAADGTPLELNALIDVVNAVRASPLWQRAAAASQRMVEVPFAIALSAEEYVALTQVPVHAMSPPVELVEGRIDLAFREAEGWVIVDYKSDAAGERIPAELMRRYRGQLELYRACWERLTGERVGEMVLLFTSSRERS